MKYWSEEEKREFLEIAVASDCSWVTRGFTSLFGVTSILSASESKVLDLHIASKHCQLCASMKDVDKEQAIDHECDVNFEGSSGSMESTSGVWHQPRAELPWHVPTCSAISIAHTSEGYQPAVGHCGRATI